VPSTREELVKERTPDWGAAADPSGQGLKATWIGHASFLIETARAQGTDRGVRILCDPVFSERTSPVQWFGPKRYTPVPCTVQDLPEVDAVVLSHNHYDHLDFQTIKDLFEKQARNKPHVFCALGNKAWFLNAGLGIETQNVTEMDWWQGSMLDVAGVGQVEFFSVPCQHNSNRSGTDAGKALWCSWVVREPSPSTSTIPAKSLFFAGDTAYRAVKSDSPTPEEEAAAPHCPAFAQIGKVFGSFDLALLPIGLFLPRHVMSSVHCSPEDSACVHKDIRAKRSIGMHYGTVRGGISGQYEDVREPPRRWKKVCEKEGFKWRGGNQNDNDWEAGLCDIGETVLVR